MRESACACGGGCPACQTKSQMNVSQPNDPAEIEADQLAEKVMRMPGGGETAAAPTSETAGGIQRKCGDCEDEEKIERKAVLNGDGAALASSGDVGKITASGGRQLDDYVRGFFEPRFGTDFSSVRVHTDALAGSSASGIGARAYTVGNDIVFGHEQFNPASESGRHLIAHELAHIVQNGRSKNVRKVFRQPVGAAIDANSSCPPGKAPAGNTAGDAAKLSLSNSKNGKPCACLLVIHNNEENARQTAELMHDHCSYNLALLTPNTGRRCIKLPGHPTDKNFDPNEFFSPAIIKQCFNDEKSCRDFVKAETGATDTAKIDDFIQMSYFLAIKDCSNSFRLPIVALHNNDINDTVNFRKNKRGKNLSSLKTDIEKDSNADSAEREKSDKKKLKPLLDELKRLFDESTMKELTQKAGKTNIFRWCYSGELSACHIGNPDQPDQVIWVTNRADFDKLKKEPLNVALQDDLGRVKKESLTDLSTMFPTLKSEAPAKFGPIISSLVSSGVFNSSKIFELIMSIGSLKASGVGDDSLSMMMLKSMLDAFVRLNTQTNADLVANTAELARYQNLRYLNIETPIHKTADQTDAGRIDNYDVIVTALKAVGLHCCGDTPTDAEDKIKAGLRLDD